MIVILFSLVLFQIGLAQWPNCPPSPGSSMLCQHASCNMAVEVTSSTQSSFSDWDIALSSVIQGPASISIDSSITIPNSWTLMPQDFCFGFETYADAINTKLGITMDTPWDVFNNGSTYSVPYDQYGILVINPWTATVSGTAENNVVSGCGCTSLFWRPPLILNNWQANIGQPDPSQGPGGPFVGGTISLLLSPTTPIPCRIGSCSHS